MKPSTCSPMPKIYSCGYDGQPVASIRIQNLLHGVWDLFEKETEENLQVAISSYIDESNDEISRFFTLPMTARNFPSSSKHNLDPHASSNSAISRCNISEGSLEFVRAFNDSANGQYRLCYDPPLLQSPLMFWTKTDFGVIKEFVRLFPYAYPYIHKLEMAEFPEQSNERFAELEIEFRNSTSLMNHASSETLPTFAPGPGPLKIEFSDNDISTCSNGVQLPSRLQQQQILPIISTINLRACPPPPGFLAPQSFTSFSLQPNPMRHLDTTVALNRESEMANVPKPTQAQAFYMQNQVQTIYYPTPLNGSNIAEFKGVVEDNSSAISGHAPFQVPSRITHIPVLRASVPASNVLECANGPLLSPFKKKRNHPQLNQVALKYGIENHISTSHSPSKPLVNPIPIFIRPKFTNPLRNVRKTENVKSQLHNSQASKN